MILFKPNCKMHTSLPERRAHVILNTHRLVNGVDFFRGQTTYLCCVPGNNAALLVLFSGCQLWGRRGTFHRTMIS